MMLLLKLSCFVVVVCVAVAEPAKWKKSLNEPPYKVPEPKNKTPVSAIELKQLKTALSTAWADAMLAYSTAVTKQLLDVAANPIKDEVDKLKQFNTHMDQTVDDCKKSTKRLLRTLIRAYIFGVVGDTTCAPDQSPCIDNKVTLVSKDLAESKQKISPSCNKLKNLMSRQFAGTVTKDKILQNEAAVKTAIIDDVICIADVMKKKMQVDIPDMMPLDKVVLKAQLLESLIRVSKTWRDVISFVHRIRRIIRAFEDPSGGSSGSASIPDPWSLEDSSRSTEMERRDEAKRLRKFLQELRDLAKIK